MRLPTNNHSDPQNIMPAEENLTCPHCGEPLKAFRMPDTVTSTSGWNEPIQWACWNDDCSYYREGWEWMLEQYEARASYRYRVIDPANPRCSPLAVWSPTALTDLIVEDEDGQ